jgi:hypothetical protein
MLADGRAVTFLRLPSDRAAARPSLGPPVLEALEYLWSSGWKGHYLPEDAPLAAIGTGWERLPSGGNVDGEPGGKIERKAYALGMVEALSDGLKRRDVHVAPSGGPTRVRSFSSARTGRPRARRKRPWASGRFAFVAPGTYTGASFWEGGLRCTGTTPPPEPPRVWLPP